MDKENTPTEILHYFFLKKKQPERNIVICYNMMKVEDIMLNEISQAQEDKYCVSYSYIKAWKE